jgi:hypothetical protein
MKAERETKQILLDAAQAQSDMDRVPVGKDSERSYLKAFVRGP